MSCLLPIGQKESHFQKVSHSRLSSLRQSPWSRPVPGDKGKWHLSGPRIELWSSDILLSQALSQLDAVFGWAKWTLKFTNLTQDTGSWLHRLSQRARITLSVPALRLQNSIQCLETGPGEPQLKPQECYLPCLHAHLHPSFCQGTGSFHGGCEQEGPQQGRLPRNNWAFGYFPLQVRGP